ncbi:MAG: peptide chain release factor N(5)-glutamine methyltransferase [Bacteroidales bacterium]|nr:peptide chain release factor N(5)-glutamine methyltransferase [Bacteroidales bacterium]
MNQEFSKLKNHFHHSLSAIYDEREIDALFYGYLDEKWGVKKHIISMGDFSLNDDIQDDVQRVLARLMQKEPLQYILQQTSFYGLPFHVTPSVLIPRPETEELVDLIIKENGDRKDLHILDIGTGSGAIAIALSKNLIHCHIDALDCSLDALQIAKQNADNLQVAAHFFLFDLLKETQTDFPYPWDIIVSNPPYIPLSHQQFLHDNVVKYEPATALFVPDEDPLLFYRKIVAFATHHLIHQGLLYFETHEDFHAEIASLLAENGYADIRSLKDINGKDRMIGCRKKE